jgi:Activator of Hsp90 ATPase homolog 1-like protein
MIEPLRISFEVATSQQHAFRCWTERIDRWGVVTVWDPPSRLGYRWHLRRTPEEATDVLITFTAVDDGTTRVDVEQTSWERLGADAQAWRDRNSSGWAGLLQHYREHIHDNPEGSTT